jgi:hypothetical protein
LVKELLAAGARVVVGDVEQKALDRVVAEFAGAGDYNEDQDVFYTPEGFYEWQSEPEINWKISAKVTHWMPLIELP